MKKDTISVIIAAYNEEKHIKECVTSLLKQSIQPSEIIIVDDGSIDLTWSILKQQKSTSPLIHIYRKKHIEQATARNFGFSKSHGNILVFPDADYYYDKNYLKILVNPISNNQVIATLAKDEYIANTDNIWSRCWQVNSCLPENSRIAPSTPKRTNNFRAIRSKEFAAAGGFSETGYSNDITVLNKLGIKDGSLVVSGAVSFHYNPDSLISIWRHARRMGSKGAVNMSLKSFIVFSFPNSLRKGINNFIIYRRYEFIVFQVVFDFGIITGLTNRFINTYIKKDINANRLGEDR